MSYELYTVHADRFVKKIRAHTKNKKGEDKFHDSATKVKSRKSDNPRILLCCSAEVKKRSLRPPSAILQRVSLGMSADDGEFEDFPC